MHGEKSPIEFETLARKLIKVLADNEADILMDFQSTNCFGCLGERPKFVYKSPASYQIGQLLDTLRKRGHL